jgi:hypothetical protein
MGQCIPRVLGNLICRFLRQAQDRLYGALDFYIIVDPALTHRATNMPLLPELKIRWALHTPWVESHGYPPRRTPAGAGGRARHVPTIPSGRTCAARPYDFFNFFTKTLDFGF